MAILPSGVTFQLSGRRANSLRARRGCRVVKHTQYDGPEYDEPWLFTAREAEPGRRGGAALAAFCLVFLFAIYLGYCVTGRFF